jgi:hypothetical protein
MLTLDEILAIKEDKLKNHNSFKSLNKSSIPILTTNVLDPSKPIKFSSLKALHDQLKGDRNSIRLCLNKGKLYKGEW